MTIKRKPFKFFLLVYALSIPLWIIQTQFDIKGLPLDIPITDIVAAFTPLIAACILVSKEEGRGGVKRLVKRIFDYSRIKQKKWYAAIILVPLLLFLVIYGVMKIMGILVPMEFFTPLFMIPFLMVFFFLGALAEEVGYTGYAIDPLQDRWGALTTGLIIGLPWAIWHYPSIIHQGHGFIWILWGTLGTIAMRILLVWIYNNAGKSLFAVILFHAFYNLGRPLFPRDASHNPLVDYPNIHYLVLALFAIIVVIFWGPKTLAKFRFSAKKKQ